MLGKNLGHYVRDIGVLSIGSIRHIGVEILKALRTLHEMNYVHQSVSPEHLMLGNATKVHKVYLVGLSGV